MPKPKLYGRRTEWGKQVRAHLAACRRKAKPRELAKALTPQQAEVVEACHERLRSLLGKDGR